MATLNNRKLANYSILLLYPDYAGDYGEKTYLAHVRSKSVVGAIHSAKEQANEDNPDLLDSRDDISVLLCIRGHHEDLTP